MALDRVALYIRAMTVPIVTAEYPREVWDQRRTTVLVALRRGRRAAWWGGGGVGVLAMCVALVLRAGWAGAVPVGACAVLAALAAGRPAHRRAERGVGDELRQSLARSGHHVTVEQARLLLRLGTCRSVDQSCLAADFSRPDRVIVVVAPPTPGYARAAGVWGDSGGSAWGGDAGDCGGDGGGGGC